jgi:CHAT domain-containing protein
MAFGWDMETRRRRHQLARSLGIPEFLVDMHPSADSIKNIRREEFALKWLTFTTAGTADLLESLADAYRIKGVSYGHVGNRDKAIEYLERSRQTYLVSLRSRLHSLYESSAKRVRSYGSSRDEPDPRRRPQPVEHANTHPKLIGVSNDLNRHYLVSGQLDAASKSTEGVVERARRRFGEIHPETAAALANQAWLNAEQGDWQRALAGFDASRKSLRSYELAVLPVLSENEQLAFVQDYDRPMLNRALQLTLKGPEHPETALITAEWVLNGKATMFESLSDRMQMVNEDDSDEVKALRKALAATRQQLAVKSLHGQQGNEIVSLYDRERDLSQQLALALGTRIRQDWVQLDTVRSSLPEDSVLIECLRAPSPSGSATPAMTEGRYLVWIVPRDVEAPVQVVDLGTASEIDAEIAGFRQSLAERNATVNDLAEVSASIYGGLKTAAQPYKHWIVSPDSQLWLVPWEALLVDDEHYVLEEHAVSYVTSGRELPVSSSATSSGAVVVADPDVDLMLESPPENDGGAEGSDPLEPASSANLTSLAGVKWSRLPGAAAEARGILPHLSRYVGEKPQLLAGSEATEKTLKEMACPRVLAICSHAFVLDDPTLTDLDQQMAQNPLARAGIVLAGANNSQSGSVVDDGILTALEVLGVDLHGTEVVVLSACETGAGKVRNGEGVAGLRQAFQLAGAKSVISSLWRVPDQETSELMIMFWQNLASGKSKAEALRGAQLAMLRRYDAQETSGSERGLKLIGDRTRLSPYYWAAFSLTGGAG